MFGYPPPEPELTDDEIGQQFLDELRAELDAAGDYGTRPWRAARDAQMHRLRSLGWTTNDLAEHYRIGRPTVLASLTRAAVDPNPTRPYVVRFRAKRGDIAAIRSTFDELGVNYTLSGTETR